jgi:hypothetical protein
VETIDAPNSREHKFRRADRWVHPLGHFIARDQLLCGVLAFEIKPILIACDNVEKMGSLHSRQRAKELTVFCDHHLPWIVCQLV